MSYPIQECSLFLYKRDRFKIHHQLIEIFWFVVLPLFTKKHKCTLYCTLWLCQPIDVLIDSRILPLSLTFTLVCSLYANSVTRLGDFWKFLVTEFLSKVAQMLGDFWSSFESHHFSRINCWGYVWATLGKIWPLFISISVPTVCKQHPGPLFTNFKLPIKMDLILQLRSCSKETKSSYPSQLH